MIGAILLVVGVSGAMLLHLLTMLRIAGLLEEIRDELRKGK